MWCLHHGNTWALRALRANDLDASTTLDENFVSRNLSLKASLQAHIRAFKKDESPFIWWHGCYGDSVKKILSSQKSQVDYNFHFFNRGASAARTLQGSIDLWLCINIRFNKKYNNNFQVLYLPFSSFMLKIENYQDCHMILYI